MSMKIKSQNGSAHVVIIVCLVLALTGALGWIFWQNFISKDEASKNITNYAECAADKNSKIQESYPEVCVTKDGKSFTNPDQKIEEDLTVDACTEHEKICFTYPQSWAYSEESKQFDGGAGTVYRDENELVSADKKIKLSISTGIGQLGGLCDPENASGYVQTVETRTVKVSFSNPDQNHTSDLYAVKVIVNTDTGRFVPGVLLSNSKILTKIGRHERCTTGYTDLFHQKNGSEGYSLMLFSSLPFFNLGAESSAKEPAYDTYDEAKAALNSQALKEAFDIILSAHY